MGTFICNSEGSKTPAMAVSLSPKPLLGWLGIYGRVGVWCGARKEEERNYVPNTKGMHKAKILMLQRRQYRLLLNSNICIP